jgi:hypothetical protein
MDIIGEEIAYYKHNRLDFMAEHNGMYLTIKGQQVIGIYKTYTQAFEETIKLHEVGTFIIERPFNLDNPPPKPIPIKK